MHQSEPCVQLVGCARGHRRHGEGCLHRPRAHACQSVLRSLACNADGRLQTEIRLMADLLLELLSEEIPARMQAQAARDLERIVVSALSDRGLLFEGAKSFAGPRRLTLALSGLSPRQHDVSEERKGPRVDAP